MLAWQTANLHRNPKRQPQPYEIEDFLVRGKPGETGASAPLGGTKPMQTAEDMKRFAEALTTGLGGRRIRRKPPKEAPADGR